VLFQAPRHYDQAFKTKDANRDADSLICCWSAAAMRTIAKLELPGRLEAHVRVRKTRPRILVWNVPGTRSRGILDRMSIVETPIDPDVRNDLQDSPCSILRS
jgi:hypothetical protein